MTSSVAFLFPGQGSQHVGMGKTFFDRYSSVKRLFEEASALVGMNFEKLCFEGPEADLARTDNVQPAITLVNLACLQALQDEGVSATAVAGHSLGEYSALCAAGVFGFADAIRLVRTRGAAMQAAAEQHPGGMTAVFGLDMKTMTAVCEDSRDAGSVEIANYNSPSQIVLTGEKVALQKAAELAKKRGAKLCIPLKVSGPWHSRFMAAAQGRMRTALEGLKLLPPAIPVLSNVSAGTHADDPDGIREALIAQMVSPVLWADCMARLIQDGYTKFAEVGPGKVLAGLMRDISRNVRVLGVQQPEDLAAVRALPDQ